MLYLLSLLFIIISIEASDNPFEASDENPFATTPSTNPFENLSNPFSEPSENPFIVSETLKNSFATATTKSSNTLFAPTIVSFGPSEKLKPQKPRTIPKRNRMKKNEKKGKKPAWTFWPTDMTLQKETYSQPLDIVSSSEKAPPQNLYSPCPLDIEEEHNSWSGNNWSDPLFQSETYPQPMDIVSSSEEEYNPWSGHNWSTPLPDNPPPGRMDTRPDVYPEIPWSQWIAMDERLDSNYWYYWPSN